MEFAYSGEFILKDGSMVQVDLESKGWATKELISNVATMTLVPKPQTSGWPLLRVHIPPNGKPVWTWRVFREAAIADASTVREMRIYGIGYKKRGQRPVMTWVVPGGHVETGTESPLFADKLWHG